MPKARSTGRESKKAISRFGVVGRTGRTPGGVQPPRLVRPTIFVFLARRGRILESAGAENQGLPTKACRRGFGSSASLLSYLPMADRKTSTQLKRPDLGLNGLSKSAVSWQGISVSVAGDLLRHHNNLLPP